MPTRESMETDITSLLLIDEQEQIVVDDPESLAVHLQCNDTKLKVVSIFGNTGDGKSHTLNQVFFGGREVFRTSANQHSCTVGVWVAYAPHHKALVVDTEGLMGVSKNENQRTRLLLKTLAISDVIIYRTRAERLHNDMFTFLDDASNAYWKYFSPELQAASERNCLGYSASSLGPSVVIFHETQFTKVLGATPLQENILEEAFDDDLLCQETAEDITAEEHIKQHFSELKLTPKAFSAIEYVGTQTLSPPTDFVGLKKRLSEILQCNSVRSPRTIDVIYKSLETLNENFMNDLSSSRQSLFPDFYFSCQTQCISCGARCELSASHKRHDKEHVSSSKCKYQHHLDNKVMLCKKCYDNGVEEVVDHKTWCDADSSWFGMAKFAWSGYVIECPSCGIIYRSREHWYGNPPAEHGSVVTENRHIWEKDTNTVSNDYIKGRKALDVVSNLSETVAKVTSPTQQFLADRVAPDYWVPNAEIINCCVCEEEFDCLKVKHHCRACGKGVCDQCSTQTMPVPWRGWGEAPVRVCDFCFSKTDNNVTESEGSNVSRRYITENITSAIGWVGGMFNYPKQVLVDTARPSYWVPDSEITHCYVCNLEFNDTHYKHHCRSCGQGVCDKCSQQKEMVPSRGWDYPVRVCDNCVSQN